MINIRLVLIIAICFCSCKRTGTTLTNSKNEVAIDNRIVKPTFQSIIDSAGVIGAILLYDYKKDAYYSNGFEWSNTGKLPASTFKIANTIIGLETGVIENDSTIFKWDGSPRGNRNWEQDLVLRDAFHSSCVPCYQEVARKIGGERMSHYLDKLDYGNMKLDSSSVDNFWLKGNSRITQMQQIEFMKRFYDAELPISERTRIIVKNLMVVEETEQYKLSGKSGLSNVNQNYNGWFVGYIELKSNTYFFATNIEPKNTFDLETFVEKRKEVTLEALKRMKIIN